MDKFDTLVKRFETIILLTDKVPSEYKNDVFKVLFEAANEGYSDDLYPKEILRFTNNGKDLIDFMFKKNPQSNIEKTLLFVYYLEKIAKIGSVLAKHVEACYDISNMTPPKNLIQNLRDCCSSKYRYLKVDKNTYSVTETGQFFCEQ